MEDGMSVSFRYFVSSDRRAGFPDLDGIDDFRNELANDYVTLIRGRAAGAGGGVQILAQIISSIPWAHVAQLIIDGVAYDLIKEGSKSFVLRPLIAAFRKLRDKNRERRFDLAELQIDFEDFQLVIREISNATIIDNLPVILHSVAENYNRLRTQRNEAPAEIHVPVFEDPDPDRACRFRETGRWDETIVGKAPDDYLAFWGVVFDHGLPYGVFDVRNGTLFEEKFNTISEHWQALERRFYAKPGNADRS